MRLFEHSRLLSDEHDIRLMKLRSAPSSMGESPVCCTLFSTTLKDAPSFYALSYAWGKASHLHHISIDGAFFQVTQNLEAALKHLRLSNAPCLLWIDAICIDQRNNAEKSAQVHMMDKIYRRATKVISWLGPSADDSDLAMDFISESSSTAQRLDFGFYLEFDKLLTLLKSLKQDGTAGQGEECDAYLRRVVSQLSKANTRLITALQALSDRPYWTRIWIVQEVSLATDLDFVCGDRSISRDDIRHVDHLVWVMENVSLRPGHHLQIDGLFSLVRPDRAMALLDIPKAPERASLEWLLWTCAEFEASDPRDRVYALAGVAGDWQSLGIVPDYSKPYLQVYTDVTLNYLRQGNFTILSQCRLATQDQGLPSWVPNWSVHSRDERSRLSQRGYPDQLGFAASEGCDVDLEGYCSSLSHVNGSLTLHTVHLGRILATGSIGERGKVGRWLANVRSLWQLGKGNGGTHRIQDSLSAVWYTASAGTFNIMDGFYMMEHEHANQINDALAGKTLEDMTESQFQDIGFQGYYAAMNAFARGRRPVLLSDGSLCIGPSESAKGDEACIILGSNVPTIIRPSIHKKKWHLVGEAYVHGAMYGETFKNPVEIQPVELY